MSLSVGMIGCGHMGRAMAVGMSDSPLIARVLALTGPSGRRTAISGVDWTDDKADLSTCDVVICAVKPTEWRPALEGVPTGPLLISVMAGIAIADLSAATTSPVVRAMPNLGSAQRRSATGCFADAAVPHDIRQRAEMCMSAIGRVAWVDTEDAINAWTAVFGSGIGTVARLGVALSNAAADLLNLDATVAQTMMSEQLQVVGTLSAESGASRPLEALVGQVCSPRGTTEAALRSLEHDHIDETLLRAAKRAHNRADEIRNQH